MVNEYDAQVLEKDNGTEKQYRIGIKCDRIKDKGAKAYSDIDSDPVLCHQIAYSEYERSINRLEHLNNKIYILCTVCSFVFAVLTSAINRVSTIRMPNSDVEKRIIVAYIIPLILSVVIMACLLVKLVCALKAVEITTFDSSEIMERDMVHSDRTRVVKYTISRYEEARTANNIVIEKRYKAVSKGVCLLTASILLLIYLSLIGSILPEASVDDVRLIDVCIMNTMKEENAYTDKAGN